MAELIGSKLAPLTPEFLTQSRAWIDEVYDNQAKIGIISQIFPRFGTSGESGYHTVSVVLTLDFIEFARTQLELTQTSTHDPVKIDTFVKEHFGNWQDGVKAYVDIWLDMAQHIPNLSDDDNPHTYPVKQAYSQKLDAYNKAREILARNL